MTLALAFIHLYSIFNLRLFFVLSFNFFKIWYWNVRTKRWMVLESPSSICHFLREQYRIREGTKLRIMFIIHFTFVKCACFVLYSICVRFDLVKSPEVTLCGWQGNKPSINNNYKWQKIQRDSDWLKTATSRVTFACELISRLTRGMCAFRCMSYIWLYQQLQQCALLDDASLKLSTTSLKTWTVIVINITTTTTTTTSTTTATTSFTRFL